MLRPIPFIIAAVLVAGCQTTPETPPAGKAPAARGAPLFDNMGEHRRAITTANPETQRYFDQGLVLAYGFNHAEAARSFREALRLDPACAMCAWGVALVLGPNINLPMLEPAFAEAYAMSRKAQSLAGNASPAEKALIAALQARYVEQPPADRSALDRAYASEMAKVARSFPDDADVLALAAEAQLDLNPWNYWAADGEPRDSTVLALQMIESAIRVSPRHPGALHYYIHAVEEPDPKRAEGAADTLRDLVPAAGHLVHMPGHIYLRVGRYKDALDVNIKAGQVDTDYIEACRVQGFYALAYHPHNWHFVWAAGQFAGMREQALLGAEKTGHLMHGQSPVDPMLGPIIQHFSLTPIYVATRFGMWDRVLSFPAPEAEAIYSRAIHHYARGMAHAGKGDLAAADAELASLRQLAPHPALPTTQVSARNNAQQIVAVAERMLTGDIAARRKQYDAAIAAFRQGVEREDELGYNEPEDWHYPVRLLLGTVLLDAGKAGEAEKVFRQDLVKHPENGWALYGLAQSLAKQSRLTEAAAARSRFEKAWQHADVELSAAVIR
jgi:tetratricopeptide (TPR) repeat protein